MAVFVLADAGTDEGCMDSVEAVVDCGAGDAEVFADGAGGEAGEFEFEGAELFVGEGVGGSGLDVGGERVPAHRAS